MKQNHTVGKTNERKKQKQREKQQRKRQQAKDQARAKAQAQALPTSERGLLKLASSGEFGPAWISEGWETPEWADRLVTVVITRRLRGRLYLAHCVLVDRSCLGAKDAFTIEPMDEHGLNARMNEFAEDGEAMVRCDVAVAQSVVFHAIGFAEGLEREPHRDFHQSMFEPRPAELLETAGARPERPSYNPNREDDIDAVLRHLDRVLGRENYDFMGRPRTEPRSEQNFEASINHASIPPERPLHPADSGADPARINWQLACTGVPWEPPLLPEPEPIRDLRPTAEPEPGPEESRWEVVDAIHALCWELEQDWHLLWEAVIRQEQQLPLSDEHSRALDDLLGEEERVRHIDKIARPCEPWYQTFNRLLDRLIIERIATDQVEDTVLLELGERLLDAVDAHALSLSLPADISSLAELLADERVSRVRAQSVFDPLIGLGQPLPNGQRVTLADPNQAHLVDEFIDKMRAAAPHLARLGWGLAELFEVVVLPAEEQGLLLEAITARAPKMLDGARQ